MSTEPVPAPTARTDQNILIESGSYAAKVIPRIGAIMSNFSHDGVPLFHDGNVEAWQPGRGVFGGNPLLFPNAGSLKDAQCIRLGTSIGHHGFAMFKPWTVQAHSANEVTLVLENDEETMKVYPLQFRLTHQYALSQKGLRVELTMENLDRNPMPVAPGWHPYFTCPADQKTELLTSMGEDVSRQLSNDKEFDFGLIPPDSAAIEFTPPGGKKQRLSFSPNCATFNFWSPAGRNFVCIEPWLGAPNALNTSQVMLIPPGDTRMLWMTVEVLE